MSIYHLRAVAAATAIAVSASAFAHDGDLDRSFGTNGLTVIDFGASATAYGLAIDASGRVVLGGVVDGGAATGSDFAVTRLTRNGQPDTDFSFDGKTTVAVGAGDAYDFNFNTIVQSDGKIVVIGEGPDTADPSDDSDFKLVRLNTDGTLDTTFSGDGKAYVNFDLGGTNSRSRARRRAAGQRQARHRRQRRSRRTRHRLRRRAPQRRRHARHELQSATAASRSTSISIS